MSTSYNVQNALYRASEASRRALLDPGSGGTIVVVPNDLCYVTLTSTGARTLQAAANVAVGTSVLCISQATTPSVNGIDVADGESIEFKVTVDSSAANQWVVTRHHKTHTTNIQLSSLRVHDAFATNLPSTAAADDLGLVLGTYGTNRTEVHYGDAAAGTISRLAACLVTVPADYRPGTALSVVVPWTRDNAAQVSATVDIEVWREAAPTVDINSTAAVDINGAASGTATFVLTTTSVVPGEQLKIRITGAADDTGGAASDHALLGLAFSYVS